MAVFAGQLNQNEIYSALYNMIISQEVFDRIASGNDLVDKARVDGGLYGDTKLFYAADILASNAWGNDSEAQYLLSLDRPSAPNCQAITINKFRQIRLTLDDYLSKRAWGDEGAFGQFNSVMEAMVGKTKEAYDALTYNAFIGTDEVAAQNKTVQVAANELPENEAKKIAQAMADLIVELKSYTRKYNEYGNMTKFNDEDIKVIWNSKFVNKIKKVDLPAIFHKDGLMDKFEDNVLEDKFFGDINANQKTADGSATRSLIEQVISTHHYFPGDLIQSGDIAPAGTSYQATTDVIAKVYVKLPPYMSAFEVGTTFFNARSLTTNRYLTFGHNTLEHLKAYPCITVVEDVTADIYGAPVEVVNTTTNPVPTEEVQ